MHDILKSIKIQVFWKTNNKWRVRHYLQYIKILEILEKCLISSKGKNSEYMKYFSYEKYTITRAFAGDCATQSQL